MMNVWNDWMAYSQLYVKLAKGTNTSNIETQLKSLLNKYNKDASKDDANTTAFHLQPLNDVHFNSLYAGFDQRLAHNLHYMNYLQWRLFYYYSLVSIL